MAQKIVFNKSSKSVLKFHPSQVRSTSPNDTLAPNNMSNGDFMTKLSFRSYLYHEELAFRPPCQV